MPRREGLSHNHPLREKEYQRRDEWDAVDHTLILPHEWAPLSPNPDLVQAAKRKFDPNIFSIFHAIVPDDFPTVGEAINGVEGDEVVSGIKTILIGVRAPVTEGAHTITKPAGTSINVVSLRVGSPLTLSGADWTFTNNTNLGLYGVGGSASLQVTIRGGLVSIRAHNSGFIRTGSTGGEIFSVDSPHMRLEAGTYGVVTIIGGRYVFASGTITATRFQVLGGFTNEGSGTTFAAGATTPMTFLGTLFDISPTWTFQRSASFVGCQTSNAGGLVVACLGVDTSFLFDSFGNSASSSSGRPGLQILAGTCKRIQVMNSLIWHLSASGNGPQQYSLIGNRIGQGTDVAMTVKADPTSGILIFKENICRSSLSNFTFDGGTILASDNLYGVSL